MAAAAASAAGINGASGAMMPLGPLVVAAEELATAARAALTSEDRSELQRQLFETREKLATLEAEQRRLIGESLGALVKAASTMGGPNSTPEPRLPSTSTFTPCPSPVNSIETPDAGLRREEDVSDLAMLVGVEAASGSVTPSGGAAAASFLSAALNAAAGSGDGRSTQLEDENRMLREAIARAHHKNSETRKRWEAVEAKNRALAAQIEHSTHELEHQHRRPATPAASPAPLARPALCSKSEDASTSRPAASAAPTLPQRRESRQELLEASRNVEEGLGAILSRRGRLQAILSEASANGPPVAGQQ